MHKAMLLALSTVTNTPLEQFREGLARLAGIPSLRRPPTSVLGTEVLSALRSRVFSTQSLDIFVASLWLFVETHLYVGPSGPVPGTEYSVLSVLTAVRP